MNKITALLLTMALLLTVMPAVSLGADTDLDSGLLLHYTFDNDGSKPSVIRDVSGHGNDGAVINVTQQVGGGRPGEGQQTVTKEITVENGAAVFPGAESVQGGGGPWGRSSFVNGAAIKIPESVRKDLEDYTVSMWVKADSQYAYGDRLQRFFDFGVGTANSIFLRYRASSGELRFQDRGIGGSADDEKSLVSTTGVNGRINDNWALLTVTYKKSDKILKVYLNGEEVLSDTSKFTRSVGDLPSLSDDTYGMYLGRTMWYATTSNNTNADNPEYKGLMDDVRIYGRALSAQEAMELYTATNPEGDKTVTGAQNPDDVYTLVGTAPSLPSTVKATLANGSTEDAEVEWETVSPGSYAAEGSFTVKGTVKGTSIGVEVKVHVVSDPTESINSGMIANYTFDTDAAQPTVIKDMSGKGNDASVLNTHYSDWGVNEDSLLTVENKSAVFPGAKEISYPWGGTGMMNGAAMQLPNDFNQGVDSYTVSMWVKADGGYAYADKYQRLFDFGNVGGDLDDSIYAAYFLRQNRLDVYDYRDNNRAGVEHRFDGEGPFTDQWGMLTVSYDYAAKTAQIYVNGEKIDTVENMPRGLSGLGTLNDSTNGLYIGRNVWSRSILDSNPDFKGLMDNIRIYDRSLGEAEVEALYETTNPQRKIKITQNIIVRSSVGLELYRTTEEAEASEFGRYTARPAATYVYGGKTYRLSEKNSSLVIDRVTDSDNSVDIVYMDMSPVSAAKVSLESYIGRAPELPARVELTYSSGDVMDAEVKWEDVSSDKYSKTGSFSVKGVADGFDVTADVVVYNVVSVRNPDVYTVFGEEPVLPATVSVTFSHRTGETVLEPVEWDAVAGGQDQESFSVKGRLVNYPDVEVTANVTYVIEAVFEKTAIADTLTSTRDRDANYGDNDNLQITSTGGSGKAAYDRYAFIRFPGSGHDATLGAKVKIFVQYIENNRYTTYTLHAIDPAYDSWDEHTLTWNTQSAFTEHSTEVATAGLDSSERDVWLEFDISGYIQENPDEDCYSFYITADTCATYASSREAGQNPPTITYMTAGRLVTVNYVSGGKTLLTETVPAAKGEAFDYADRQNIIVMDGKVYVYRSGGHMDIVDDDNYVMTVNMEETDSYAFDDISVDAYYDEAPALPAEATLRSGDYALTLPAVFETKALGDYGTYMVYGEAEGLEVPATVRAYGRYYSDKGALLGYASRVTVKYSDPVSGYKADDVELEVRTGGSVDEETVLGYYPQLRNTVIVSGGGEVTEPTRTVTVTGELYTGVSANYSAALEGDDPSAYSVTVSASAANTGGANGGLAVVVARYGSDGRLTGVDMEKKALLPEMKGRDWLTVTADGYDRTANENIKIYVWEQGTARPLGKPIAVSELPDPQRYSDEVLALIPEYADVKENVLRANNYYQATNNADAHTFWDIAAYHTGNLETYFTFGGDDYLDYSFRWAESRDWMGNRNTSTPKENWTWNYPSGDSDTTTDVLFGDWQICFQSFLDMYLLDPDRADISRVEEVMGYQITKSNDDYWWWADALYMVPPILTKMYLNTGNETYIDKLYDYYRFSAELMYDGDCGIPNKGATNTENGEGYTTSADRYKKNGSYFSDPDDYAHLFYRDAGYVYPLSANSGHESEKNFWARGNGWVFAGLAKIITDIPEDHESYSYFTNLYKEMAAAIIACQQEDDEGRGFWTQSMLQNYPRSSGNEWGYETSGTAFFTYGLFWGLNSGLLDEDTYLEPALRGWKYLSEVALQDNGKVGYCQQIGSNAAQATEDWRDQPFGYGAFLLAGCELSRWVGGVEKNNAPYLKRRLWGAVAAADGRMYIGGEAIDSTAYVEDGVLYLPVEQTAEAFHYTYDAGSADLADEVNGGIYPLEGIVTKDGVDYAPAEALAETVGRYATDCGGVTVISRKRTVFYDDESEAEAYLKSLLEK